MLKCADGDDAHFHIGANLTDYGCHNDDVNAESEPLDLDFQNLLELREITDRLLGVQ